MTAIERHRQTWKGKSDEWLFERLDNELKQKVEEIHRLLVENEALRKHHVIQSVCDCQNSMTSHLDKKNDFICGDCDRPYKQTVL